jgi:hypothetical protein
MPTLLEAPLYRGTRKEPLRRFLKSKLLYLLTVCAFEITDDLWFLGFEISKTDSKGTVLVEDASELESYNKTEELKMEEKVKAISEAGVGLVVCGGTISEMAMHFFERYKIMVVKTASKFELRRICFATRSRGSMTLVCIFQKGGGNAKAR